MNLVHVPSGAADQIAVFLPQHNILLSSEVIPAQHFPALNTLRGEVFRSPIDWYRSIDALRRFRAAAMVPSHGIPVVGADAVEEVMRNYRDAIQYVHDQTIRHMNKGLTPDELVQVVKLPPHLAGYKPWMLEFFGTVRQAVRGIYQGYLGWFEGDPVALAPVPRPEGARREVELMGGRDRVLAAADQAFEDGDPQWAAELATKLIRVDHNDMAARRLKAAAFRKLGYAEVNAIWRNWYLSGARGLEIVDPELIRTGMARLARFVASPDLIAALPARAFVEGFVVRLKAEETLDVVMTVGFRFPDTGEVYGIAIRRGVAQFMGPRAREDRSHAHAGQGGARPHPAWSAHDAGRHCRRSRSGERQRAHGSCPFLRLLRGAFQHTDPTSRPVNLASRERAPIDRGSRRIDGEIHR